MSPDIKPPMSTTFKKAAIALRREHGYLFREDPSEADAMVRCVLRQLSDPPAAVLDAGTRSTSAWLDLPMRGVMLRRAKMNIRWNAMIKAIIECTTVADD